MPKSIIVDDLDNCIYCGKPNPQIHHCFFGPNRSIADKYGLIVPLCLEHHTGGPNSPHRNRIIDLALKCWAQSIYELKIGDRDDFRRDFGKSYL